MNQAEAQALVADVFSRITPAQVKLIEAAQAAGRNITVELPETVTSSREGHSFTTRTTKTSITFDPPPWSAL